VQLSQKNKNKSVWMDTWEGKGQKSCKEYSISTWDACAVCRGLWLEATYTVYRTRFSDSAYGRA